LATEGGLAIRDDQPLRILLTLHYPLDPNAGAAGCTLRLAASLRERGHEVSVFGFDQMRGRRDSKLDLLSFPFQASALALRRLRADDVDVVDASTGDLWPTSRGMVRRCRGIAVTRSHGLENHEAAATMEARDRGELELSRRYFVYYGGIRLKQVARSLRVADADFFLSTNERAWAVEHLALDPRRSEVVRNGLADSFIGLPPPRAYGKGPLGIAVIGPFIWRKGAETAAAVLSRVLQRAPTAHASWLGAPDEEVKAAVDPSVRERVRVVSHYRNEDLPSLLEGHHALLLLSRSEGYPGAVLEAMACGLAVISTDVGECRALLEPTGAGVIVPPADVDAIATTVGRLAGDPARLDQMRRNGHRKAQDLGWSEVAAETERLYRRVIEEKSH